MMRTTAGTFFLFLVLPWKLNGEMINNSSIITNHNQTQTSDGTTNSTLSVTESQTTVLHTPVQEVKNTEPSREMTTHLPILKKTGQTDSALPVNSLQAQPTQSITGVSTGLMSTIRTAPLEIASTGKATEPVPTIKATTGKATEPASTTIATTGKATEPVPTIKATTGKATEPASTTLATTGKATEPVPTIKATTGKATESVLTTIATIGKTIKSASTSIATIGKTTKPMPTTIATTVRATVPAPTTIATTGKKTEPMPTTIATTGKKTEPMPTTIVTTGKATAVTIATSEITTKREHLTPNHMAPDTTQATKSTLKPTISKPPKKRETETKNNQAGTIAASLIGLILLIMFIAICLICVRKRQMKKKQLENTDWAGPTPFIEGDIQPNLPALDEDEPSQRDFKRFSLHSFLPQQLFKGVSLLKESEEVQLEDVPSGITFGQSTQETVHPPNGTPQSDHVQTAETNNPSAALQPATDSAVTVTEEPSPTPTNDLTAKPTEEPKPNEETLSPPPETESLSPSAFEDVDLNPSVDENAEPTAQNAPDIPSPPPLQA